MNGKMDSLKILIVEDSSADRKLYKRFLTRDSQDFRIYEVDNANDGIDFTRRNVVDCIILDYYLPDTNGLDFMKMFREESLAPETAIVMVTGQGSEETAVQAMKSGAADYITKNSIIEGLFVHTIMNAIERAQLRKKVEQYQESLEHSNQALSDFAHTVSHDLKAPLRRMMSFCKLLEEEAGEKLDGEAKTYVERISANAGRMQRFIDDLLAYSGVLHSHEDQQAVDLNKTVKEVIEVLDPVVQENEAHITVEDLPVIPVYPTKIRQLFLNLISNAIKYHGERVPVIRIGCDTSGDKYLFIVQDNGIGIAPQYHEEIFRAFERLHSHDAIEGTGLGLSICQKVLDQHNGEIWVESEEGKGAKFFFTLPKPEPVRKEKEAPQYSASKTLSSR